MFLIDLMVILFLVVFIFGPIGTWCVAMYSICDHSASEFTNVGQNKWLWLGMNLLFGPFGSLAYLIGARPTLKRARNEVFQPVPEQRNNENWGFPYPVEPTDGYRKGSSNEYFPEYDPSYRPKT